MHADMVTELELDAYVDGELEPARCLAVEQYLARTPAAAARMMADLSLRTALRLAQPPLDPAPALDAAARRLDMRLKGRERSRPALFRKGAWIGAGAAAASLAAALLFVPAAPMVQASPPTYVADAVEAYRTGLLRADMPSQIEAPKFDPGDVARFTRIRVPILPAGWRITDVQLFPSDDGPALQVMVRTPQHKAVSIFAVRSKAHAPDRPATVRRGAAAVAYWRHGDMAYALTGMEAPAALDLAAQDLADNRLD